MTTMKLNQWIEADSRVLEELEALLAAKHVEIGNMAHLRQAVDECRKNFQEDEDNDECNV